jgi:hypothetical protein
MTASQRTSWIDAQQDATPKGKNQLIKHYAIQAYWGVEEELQHSSP